MTKTLEILIARARAIKMDDRQMRDQRLSFVYGKTSIEDDRITRDTVAEADRNVARETIIELPTMP